MLYLGIKMQRNGDLTKHIKERMKRANVVMKQVWGIGEINFQNDFKRRMDAVRLSGCGSHVVRGRTFRLEGEDRMRENTTEMYRVRQITFSF